MKETILLDLQEYKLSEGRKWKILDQIIDLDYNGDVGPFVEEILQHRIWNGFQVLVMGNVQGNYEIDLRKNGPDEMYYLWGYAFCYGKAGKRRKALQRMLAVL